MWRQQTTHSALMVAKARQLDSGRESEERKKGGRGCKYRLIAMSA
jgi:hypothetical protein